MLSISPDGALAAANAKASEPLRPGDVIVAIAEAKEFDPMLEKIRTELSFKAEVLLLHKSSTSSALPFPPCLASSSVPPTGLHVFF